MSRDKLLAYLMAPRGFTDRNTRGFIRSDRAVEIFSCGILQFKFKSSYLDLAEKRLLANDSSVRRIGKGWGRLIGRPRPLVQRALAKLSLLDPRSVISVFKGGFRRLRRSVPVALRNLKISECFGLTRYWPQALRPLKSTSKSYQIAHLRYIHNVDRVEDIAQANMLGRDIDTINAAIAKWKAQRGTCWRKQAVDSKLFQKLVNKRLELLEKLQALAPKSFGFSASSSSSGEPDCKVQ